MNELFIRAAILKADLEIPEVEADFNAPFLSTGKQILGWALAGGTIVAVLAAIIAITLIGTGVLGERHKAKGWVAFGVCLVVGALLGSVTALMAWSGNLVLI